MPRGGRASAAATTISAPTAPLARTIAGRRRRPGLSADHYWDFARLAGDDHPE